jgi:hypothetical protein
MSIRDPDIFAEAKLQAFQSIGYYQSPNLIQFHIGLDSREVAKISADGVMRFTVDANDENAAKFVECIENFIGRRLTGIEVERKVVE